MGDSLIVKVECTSGSEYADRPLALVYDKERWIISEVHAEEYTPNGKRFHVVLEDGRALVLEYCELQDAWKLTGSI